jgi:hypothetical protein
MFDRKILISHRQKMGQKFPIYQLFEPLEKADLQVKDLAALCKEASQLTELAILSGITPDTEIQHVANTIVQLSVSDAQSAFFAWRSAIARAYPSRDGMRLLFRSFGEWLKSAGPNIRAVFFEVLPKIAPCIEQLGTEGINQLLQTISAFDSTEDRELFLNCIATYGETSAQNILGICHVANGARKLGHIDYLKRIMETIPPEGKDANKLIPALAQLNEECIKRGEEIWCQTMDLILILAERNYSSAHVTARRLSKPVQELPPDVVLSYIKDFQKLVHAIGIRVVGFSTKSLPAFYGKFGKERTHRFIETTVLVAEYYGTTAGQWFYEQRTSAARELLRE